jgi:8-oxo-dGTP diphosphatase
MRVQRAAGGLLWRDRPSGPELAVVHRSRQQDWGLPKGKLDRPESWKEAALREVQEETGCEARITRFAGATWYRTGGDLKVVLYWHMALVREGHLDAGDEIDALAWLSPEDAWKRLDHRSDRRLVARALRRRSVATPDARATRGLKAGAAAGVALAAGLALGVSLAPPAKRRAMIAGGASGLAGAASIVLAALAHARRRHRGGAPLEDDARSPEPPAPARAVAGRRDDPR